MTLPVGFHIEGTVTLILILVFRIFLAIDGEDLGVWMAVSRTFWMKARSVMIDSRRGIAEDNHLDGLDGHPA